MIYVTILKNPAIIFPSLMVICGGESFFFHPHLFSRLRNFSCKETSQAGRKDMKGGLINE